TIPFFVRRDISYQRQTGSYEICTPDPGGPGGGGGDDHEPILMYENRPANWLNKLLGFFEIKKALALYPGGDGGGEICDTVNYDYVEKTYTPGNPNVYINDQANFVPVNITTPGPGTYVLSFQMVDMNNLNNASAGKFGTPGDITLVSY